MHIRCLLQGKTGGEYLGRLRWLRGTPTLETRFHVCCHFCHKMTTDISVMKTKYWFIYVFVHICCLLQGKTGGEYLGRLRCIRGTPTVETSSMSIVFSVTKGKTKYWLINVFVHISTTITQVIWVIKTNKRTNIRHNTCIITMGMIIWTYVDRVTQLSVPGNQKNWTVLQNWVKWRINLHVYYLKLTKNQSEWTIFSAIMVTVKKCGCPCTIKKLELESE